METNKDLIRQAQRRAYKRLWVHDFLGVRRHLYEHIDRRTKLGKLIVKYIDNKCDGTYKPPTQEDRQKRKLRLANQPPKPLKITELPLVKDWLAHRRDVTFIGLEYLQFGQRKHWTKTNTDFRFLVILRRLHPELKQWKRI